MLRNFHPLTAPSRRGIVCVTPDDYVPFRTFRGYGVILIVILMRSPDVVNQLLDNAPPGIYLFTFEINRHVVIVL